MVLRCEKFEIGGQMGGKVVGTRLTLQGLRFEFWSNLYKRSADSHICLIRFNWSSANDSKIKFKKRFATL